MWQCHFYLKYSFEVVNFMRPPWVLYVNFDARNVFYFFRSWNWRGMKHFLFFILKQFQMNSLNSPPSKKNTTENPTKLSLGVYELPLGVRAGHFSDMSPRQQPAHWHHQSTCWQSSLVNLPTYLILTLFSKGTYTALWTALSQKMVTKISVGKLISGVRELTKSVGELSYSVSMLVVRVMTCQQSDQ